MDTDISNTNLLDEIKQSLLLIRTKRCIREEDYKSNKWIIAKVIILQKSL
jgi:hypothetical protein